MTWRSANTRPTWWLRGRWGVVVVVATYVAAAAFVVMLFWVLPRAAASRDLGSRSLALFGSVASANAEMKAAQANLAALTDRLASAQRDLAEMQHSRDANARTIRRLQMQIRELEAERAAAEQAARSSTTSTAETISPAPPPIPECLYGTLASPDVTPYLSPCPTSK